MKAKSSLLLSSILVPFLLFAQENMSIQEEIPDCWILEYDLGICFKTNNIEKKYYSASLLLTMDHSVLIGYDLDKTRLLIGGNYWQYNFGTDDPLFFNTYNLSGGFLRKLKKTGNLAGLAFNYCRYNFNNYIEINENNLKSNVNDLIGIKIMIRYEEGASAKSNKFKVNYGADFEINYSVNSSNFTEMNKYLFVGFTFHVGIGYYKVR